MKKQIAKRVTSCLMGLTMLTGLVGCADGDGKKVDPNKTQLYLGVTSEGIDEAWLDSVIEGFEKEYPDYQVWVDPITDTELDTLETDMPTSRQDLYYLQNMSNPKGWYDKGLIDDITDVVTVGDPAFEEGTTIESKIMDDVIDTYRFENESGDTRYFGVPYVLVTYGIVYDADLFTRKNLFNLAAYKGLDCVEGTADDNYGPDGVEGGFDDGLPATWEDFKALMSTMVQRGVTPFVWSGEHAYYRINLTKAMLASYEGAAQHRLYYDLNGYDEQLKIDITPSNAWKLVERPSQEAVLTAVSDIVKNTKNYSAKSFYLSTSHLQAQNEFILSTRTETPIGMLIEGGWWENEAKSTFEEMERYGEQYGYGKRNFKYMPLPKFIGTDGVEDQIYKGTTVYSEFGESMVCLNSASSNKEGAKLFLRYSHTNASLKAFTLDNGMARPFEYDFDETEFASLSKYAQSVWSIVRDENTEIVTPAKSNPTAIAHAEVVNGLRLTGTNGTANYTDPFLEFYRTANMTVADYLTAMKNKYNESTWNIS
ncbi:MAG: extracellular solute-binding protein [Clostridia bacterium]|nr:extracellular solute-binding protein [Clostridia bacterium]